MLTVRNLKKLPLENVMFAVDKENHLHKLVIDEKSVAYIERKFKEHTRRDNDPFEYHIFSIRDFTDTVIVSEYQKSYATKFNIGIEKLYTTAKGARMAARAKNRQDRLEKEIDKLLKSEPNHRSIQEIIENHLNLKNLSEKEKLIVKTWFNY